MCGIAGFIGSTPDASTVIQCMTEALARRGPDGAGTYVDGLASFGHRRLSSIDLAGGQQPMLSMDHRYVITFNGEIYNYKRLRDELSALGYHFQTQGDTEVILAGYICWGEEKLLNLLRGMFAFAIWDKDTQTLFAARDQLGIKPFHYTSTKQHFIFASEIKSLLLHPSISNTVDETGLGLYLESQFIPAPRSIFQDIQKLPPAHALRWVAGDLKLWRYWQADYVPKYTASEAELLEALDEQLNVSVQHMLVADVTVGAFLSGGVDSSLIAAIMQKQLGQPIHTFNVGFDEASAGSEHLEAEQVARHIGSNHHSILFRSVDVVEHIQDLFNILDEPLGDQAALPTLMLAKYAAQSVKVVLTGEGADEVFAGYSNYTNRIRDERVTSILGGIYSPFHYLVKYLPRQIRKERLLYAMSEPLARRYRTIPSIFDRVGYAHLYTPHFLHKTSAVIADYAEQYFDTAKANDYLDQLLQVDSSLWLPDDLLTKVDRTTMAAGLEARVPYLDHHFVTFAARLPVAMKVHPSGRKYLLKKLAERYLPSSIVHRPKHGFVLPLSEWLNGKDLRADVLFRLGPKGLEKRGVLHPPALRDLIQAHYRGKRNHAGRIWALYLLEHWFTQYAPDYQLD